jgi:NAD-dependent deacetylase
MKTLQSIIDESENIVFFGGAGVSTESGIPDFRSADGLYSERYEYPPEEMLSHPFFIRHTAEFFDFYRSKILHLDAKPGEAHKKLAALEKAGKLKAVITQNIDGLHQKAGSENVLELHGSVYRNYCVKCGRGYGVEHIVDCAGIPECACGGVVRPDVVLYGENLDPDTMESTAGYISAADTLIVGGTSLSVYPAAGLIRLFSGANLVLINKTPTPYDGRANLVINSGIGEVFSKIRI